jgi:co-chaperonin GroES (HSP10)
MRGTVVAVGRGPAHAARVRAATLDSCLALIARLGAECQAGPDLARRLTDALRQARAAPMGWSELEPGQVVYFPPTAGSRMVVDGEPWLLMAEDEIAAVWAEEAR